MVTKYNVQGLVDKMVEKYGLVLAIILLKQQYKYKITAKKMKTRFTDDNQYSPYYGTSYEVRRYLTQEERNGLIEILTK